MSMHEWSCQKSHWLYNMTYLGKGTTKEKCKHDWRRKIHTYPNDNLAVSIHFIHQKLAPYPFVILFHIVHSTIIHSSIMHTFGIYMEVFMYINRRWVRTDIWSRCDRACCTFVYFPRVNNDWLALPTYLYYTSMS